MSGHGLRQSELPLGAFQRLSAHGPLAEQGMLQGQCPQRHGAVCMKDRAAMLCVCSGDERQAATMSCLLTIAVCCTVPTLTAHGPMLHCGPADSAGRLLAGRMCRVHWHVQCNILGARAFAVVMHSSMRCNDRVAVVKELGAN